MAAAAERCMRIVWEPMPTPQSYDPSSPPPPMSISSLQFLFTVSQCSSFCLCAIEREQREKVPQAIRSKPHLTTSTIVAAATATSNADSDAAPRHSAPPVSSKPASQTAEMPANNNSIAAIPVLERIEQKKASVKYRLNELVDDLFAYLTSELTQQLTVPPDRLLLTATLHHQQQRPQQSIERAPVQDDSSVASPVGQAAAVDLSLSSTSDHHQYPHQYRQHSQEEKTITNAHTDASSITNAAVVTQGGSSAGSSIITVHTVQDDLDDLDDMDEHSDSDCDCEQCMGVPICKVDLEEAEIRELKAAAAAAGHSASERPSKRARTSALAAGANSINYSPSSPPSPLSTEAIADLQEDFHLQETVHEQCSATFKTISIKCSRDDCRSMFKNKVERNQHLLTVHGTQPYVCLMQDCNQGFDNVRQYGEHVNSVHKEVNHWPCTKCPKVCTDHRLLCRHIYFYHQEGRFKCRKSKCCFVAPYRIDVRKHSQLHTEMYACQFGCGKSFSHTHHRKRHERIHLKLKPFVCKLCNYCSEARSTVIRHIRIRHFNLPLTLKQQNELNIVDNRDPRDYMEIISELMN
ncbi:hypothetical protein TYRP_013706 [Tyrophagus putrescentiae]|nr:hypothetical protein TYRP_013706 [Tyrophagus putrescentiae]